MSRVHMVWGGDLELWVGISIHIAFVVGAVHSLRDTDISFLDRLDMYRYPMKSHKMYKKDV